MRRGGRNAMRIKRKISRRIPRLSDKMSNVGVTTLTERLMANFNEELRLAGERNRERHLDQAFEVWQPKLRKMAAEAEEKGIAIEGLDRLLKMKRPKK